MITLTITKPLSVTMGQNIVRFIAAHQQDGYAVDVSGDDSNITVTASTPREGYRRFLKDFVLGTDVSDACDICSKAVTNHTPDCERYRENQLRAVGVYEG